MATNSPLPMFGAWNEHWKNHPAGLPISKYKPGTNPNTGAASVDSAWNAARQAAAATNPTTTTTPTTTTPTTTTPTTTTPTTTTPTTTTPNPNAGTTPTTGFAAKYTPAMLNQLYENPWYILPDVFQGLQTSSPLYQQLRDLGADPLALFNIMQGGQTATGGGAADFTNWLANVYQGQGTTGGPGFNAAQLLGQIFGAGNNTSLGQILGAGDMSTQIRTLYNLARDASSVSMNPLAARGYQAALARAGDQYGTSQLGAPAAQSKSPQEWLRANMPWLTMGG